MDAIKQLREYEKYAKEVRSQFYKDVVGDCVEVLSGNFDKIKQRDINWSNQRKKSKFKQSK